MLNFDHDHVEESLGVAVHLDWHLSGNKSSLIHGEKIFGGILSLAGKWVQNEKEIKVGYQINKSGTAGTQKLFERM